MKNEIVKKIAKLIDLKSIIMIIMTITMVKLLVNPIEINKELLMLFSTAYGSMSTYYYNRKKDGENNGNNE